MQVVYERCCGLDVHKRAVVACVLAGQERTIRSFGTMTEDLESLAAWLEECGVTHVAMESTGVLEAHTQCAGGTCLCLGRSQRPAHECTFARKPPFSFGQGTGRARQSTRRRVSHERRPARLRSLHPGRHGRDQRPPARSLPLPVPRRLALRPSLRRDGRSPPPGDPMHEVWRRYLARFDCPACTRAAREARP